MRFNTGNPVEPDGSSSPFDLYDNAAIADLLLNGPLGEYLSRLGVPLKSWRGIMQQVTDYLIAQGYESVYLVYGAGVVVERQTQLIQRDGELYRVMNAADIPLALTGTWATDASKLQAVGDAALRQALATTAGAGLIGYDKNLAYPGGTVGDFLKSGGDSAAYRRKNGLLLANAYVKLKTNLVTRIVCQGDSITAGQDTTSVDIIPDPAGNYTTVASVQYPGAMEFLLRTFTNTLHTAIKRGYSGDTAKMSYGRWTTNPGADVVHVMLGINDSIGTNGATFAEYMEYMELIIKRYIDWGCGVVLHTATPINFGSQNRLSSTFTQGLRTLAASYGCPVFDSMTFCQYALWTSVYSDSTHFTSHGYNKYGNAVAAFIMAGGWVMEPKMVKGEIQLQTGRGSEGIGFASRGAALSASVGSYMTNRATGEFTAQNDRISYTFFMDTEYMDVYGIGQFDDLRAELSYSLGATYSGDTRAPGSTNEVVIESQRNRVIRETTQNTTAAGRTRSSGNITLLGNLVGRGWKTVSVVATATITGSRFFAGIILKEMDFGEVGRPLLDPVTVGVLSPASMDTLIYQHPYPITNSDSTAPPAASALPVSMYLPCPRGLLPYKSPGVSHYDHVPLELLITSPSGWIKVLIRRTSSAYTLTVTKIAGDTTGDTYLPTSAEFFYKAFDDVAAAPTGSYVSGIGSGSQNQYLRLTFGATTASYYQLVLHSPHKSGAYGL